jgi:hypothetical protein
VVTQGGSMPVAIGEAVAAQGLRVGFFSLLTGILQFRQNGLFVPFYWRRFESRNSSQTRRRVSSVHCEIWCRRPQLSRSAPAARRGRSARRSGDGTLRVRRHDCAGGCDGCSCRSPWWFDGEARGADRRESGRSASVCVVCRIETWTALQDENLNIRSRCGRCSRSGM